jgi:inosine-uridine nucleoside N-ribohydrolase
MGGTIDQRGNASSGAEFNLWADPAAARDVVAAAPIHLVPLDVTLQVLLEDRHVAALAAGNDVAAMCARMASFYVAAYQATGHAGGAMHDPLAVMLAVHPELATWERLTLDVGIDDENRGLLTRAATGQPVDVAMQVDAAAALDLLLTTLLE